MAYFLVNVASPNCERKIRLSQVEGLNIKGAPNSSDHSPAVIIFAFQVKSHSVATGNDQSLSSIPVHS